MVDPELGLGGGLGDVSRLKKIIFKNENKRFDEGLFNRQGSWLDDYFTKMKLSLLIPLWFKQDNSILKEKQTFWPNHFPNFHMTPLVMK